MRLEELEKVWDECPLCQSENITGHTPEIYGVNVFQEVTCRNCNASWTEEYEAKQRSNIRKGQTNGS